MIETHRLTKRYRRTTAVDGLSLRVEPGRSTASSASTARASPPRSGCCSA
ncbi:hypothetical protein [Actinomadura madurae]|nr:hypothetical protein [Actinomadura madurae]MCP9955418.1 hypothetical protein [Actinomadura madurae]MCP9972150.1 hypothetical protein [Actinomadura madurae]MCP9984655.1 hypothetical protein [Actinomadura madurae]